MFQPRTARNLASLHHDQQRGLNCSNLIYLLLRMVFSYLSQQIRLEGKEQHPQWFTDCWWYQIQLPTVRRCSWLCCVLLLWYPQWHTWACSPTIIQPPRLQSPLRLLSDHDPCYIKLESLQTAVSYLMICGHIYSHNSISVTEVEPTETPYRAVQNEVHCGAHTL